MVDGTREEKRREEMSTIIKKISKEGIWGLELGRAADKEQEWTILLGVL